MFQWSDCRFTTAREPCALGVPTARAVIVVVVVVVVVVVIVAAVIVVVVVVVNLTEEKLTFNGILGTLGSHKIVFGFIQSFL